MITFEALNAKFGDAILLRYTSNGKERLWIIDGGPSGTWNNFLLPRLKELKGNSDSLIADLAMLSHVDADHVHGMLQMTKAMTGNDSNKFDFLEIRRFWHNSFADLVGSESRLKKGLASLAGLEKAATAAMANENFQVPAGDNELTDRREFAVIASINQGRELRDYIEQLQLTGNEPFGDVLSSKLKSKTIDGAKVTVIGPISSRLELFRQEWDKAVGKPAAMAALFRDDLDESPTNLSSIVLLVEIDNKKILLTGDARGDDILDGFKDRGLATPMPLQILKMPHHGSDRNITENFLKAFPAKHYVISADGKYGNPDPDTIEAIVEVRGDDHYKIHLTNDVDVVTKRLKKLSTGRNFEYAIRDPENLSIAINL